MMVIRVVMMMIVIRMVMMVVVDGDETRGKVHGEK